MATAHIVMKDIIGITLAKGGVYGGIRFDERDFAFESQPVLVLLPKIVTVPFETLVGLYTFGLSETNKDMIVGMLADACCEKLEQFVYQTTFSAAGALKLEEIVRALGSLFSRHASSPVRGKFARLREIMQVLTVDESSRMAVSADSFTHLTANEVDALLGLRIDSGTNRNK